MDKVDFTKQGGDPLTLDNLEYLQDAIKDGIKYLGTAVQPTPSTNVILSGIDLVVLVGHQFSYTAGYVLMNGEVFYVPASMVFSDLLPEIPFVDVNQTIDTAGDEVFEDLTTKSTYLKREAKVVLSTGSPTELALSTFDRVHKETAWMNLPTLQGTWTIPSTVAGSPNICKYRINKLGNVEFRGFVDHSVAGSSLVFYLPTELFPLSTRVFQVFGGAGGDARCEISLYGDFSIVDGGGTGQYCLDGIEYTPNE